MFMRMKLCIKCTKYSINSFTPYYFSIISLNASYISHTEFQWCNYPYTAKKPYSISPLTLNKYSFTIVLSKLNLLNDLRALQRNHGHATPPLYTSKISRLKFCKKSSWIYCMLDMPSNR